MDTERAEHGDEHNRIGYLNVDEEDSSSESGAEEPDVAKDVEHPGEDGPKDRTT
jgi:hypothetical protein